MLNLLGQIQGLPDFVRFLDDICREIPERRQSGLFRLPVDRVFTMKGFGTVITGTLIAGKVSVGDPIMLYPSKITSKVRGVQVHGASVPVAAAGMRTAINFQGLDKSAVNRGDVVAAPESLVPSYIMDVSLSYLRSNPKAIKNRRKVRFHTGTSEIMGTILLLDRDELNPGESALAQIHLDTPVALVKDDHYVLRSYSPVRTIGGGTVLNPIPSKHKRFKPEVINRLQIIHAEPIERVVPQHIETAGFRGCSFRNLLVMANLPEKQLEQMLQNMMSKQLVTQIDKEKRLYVHQNTIQALEERIREHLAAYHRNYPLKAGMSREELKSKLPTSVDTKLFTVVLHQMVKAERLAQQEDIVHLAEHRVALGIDQQSLREQIIDIYRQGDLMPPYFKDICQQLKTTGDQARQVLALLAAEGLLVKVKEDLYYHIDPLQRLQNKLVDFLSSQEEISTPQFKDMTGASRKFVIPLIEYFDSIQLTIRVGDIRKLRKRPAKK